MFSRRLLGFLGLAVPPKSAADTPDVPPDTDGAINAWTDPRDRASATRAPKCTYRFKAGDPIADFITEDDRWRYVLRPCTQEEADELNAIDPEHDEHGVEALRDYEHPVEAIARRVPIGWVWLGLILSSWALTIGGGYGLYRLLVWAFGVVP